MRCLASLLTSLAVILTPLTAVSAPALNLGPLVKKAMQSPGTPVLNPSRTVNEKTRLQINKNYGKLPLRFEKNDGQTDEKVRFLSRGKGYSMYLTPTEAVMVLSKTTGGKKSDLRAPESSKETPESRKMGTSAIRMKLIDSNPDPKIYGQNEQVTKSNYLIGNDPSKWKTGVSSFGRVKYEEVYPGIDLVFYGNQQKLEYDFIVKPGADPGTINFEFEGEDSIAVDWDGNLRLETAIGEIVERAPIVYQNTDGQRKPVGGKYILADNKVSFELSDYDREQELVIDPVLEYSTYLGGSEIDQGFSIAIDAAGNAYLSGQSESTDFPTTSGGYQTSFGGVFRDAFVAKLNTSGTALEYSTYLGGTSGEQALSIVVDAAGNAFLTGVTHSNDFPTTPGAFQEISPGPDGGWSNCFVTKLNATGTALEYSTYLGGSTINRNDRCNSIAVDAFGNAFLTGTTESMDFPTTPGAFQSSHSGDSGDVFVTKLNSTGTGLEYSTYIGGISNEEAKSIAIDLSGNAYITGFTFSNNFPTTPGAFQPSFAGGFNDAFVTKLNATGTALEYSTYLGGTGFNDQAWSIAVDAAGNAYVLGRTNSTNFPITLNAFQDSFAGSAN